MDKYELKITLREIDRLVSDGKLEEAADLADQIDWRRIKSVRELCKASDIYKANRRYEDSKRVLEMAYAKNPRERRILFSLCELELKLGGFVRALQLYNEYRSVAPDDPDGYILQYKIYKTQNVSIQERIAVLEEFEKHDFREKWAYELAYLYYEAGERTLCISACDELIAFYGSGRYVLKALELKGSLTDLTPAQKKRYAALMRRVQERRRPAEDSSETLAESKAPASSEVPAEPEASPAEEAQPEETVPPAQEQEIQPEEQPDGQETTEEQSQEQEDTPAPVSGATQVYQKEDLLPKLGSLAEQHPVSHKTQHQDLPFIPQEIPWEFSDDTEITQEAMQQVIVKGLQELHNYDTYLAQETDGQYALVMQEEPAPEKQIPGQLNLEEIMAEWEKVRRSLYDPSEDKQDSGEENSGEGGREQGKLRRRTTKSWDPDAVHDALRIRDDDGVHFDTSLFVTEDGGEFPGEYIPESPPSDSKDRENVSTRSSASIPYLHSEDSMRKMMSALEDVRLEGAHGNVVITGDEGSGTMSLAREMLQRYRGINGAFVGQIVKTKGYLIDRDNLTRAMVRIPYGALVIERASSMSEEASAAMTQILTAPERNVIVVMIDRKGNMDAFLRDHPVLAGMFGARVEIAALGVETLVGYAREYAARQNCEIDEYGIGALRSRILSMQTVEYSVTLEDVRDLVDEAVYYAARGIIPGLRDTLTGRRGAGVLKLRDRDFLHF